MKKILYKNKTIAYTVCKAKVKNLYISIQNGEVVVKAPWYVTSSQIQEVIEEKRKWIIKKHDIIISTCVNSYNDDIINFKFP